MSRSWPRRVVGRADLFVLTGVAPHAHAEDEAPRLRVWRVAACLATATARRRGSWMTQVPSAARSVAVAATVRTTRHSRHGPCQKRWSHAQSASAPACSARRQSSASSASGSRAGPVPVDRLGPGRHGVLHERREDQADGPEVAVGRSRGHTAWYPRAPGNGSITTARPAPPGRARRPGVRRVGPRHGRMGERITPSARAGSDRRRKDDPVDTRPSDDVTTATGTDVPVDSAAAPLTDEERGARLAALTSIIELMRPAVQADGGDLALISADVETGVVEVQLQGACSSCAISSSTLQGGVERILHQRLDWVTEVVGGVDDSVDPFVSESMGRGGYVPELLRHAVPQPVTGRHAPPVPSTRH